MSGANEWTKTKYLIKTAYDTGDFFLSKTVISFFICTVLFLYGKNEKQRNYVIDYSVCGVVFLYVRRLFRVSTQKHGKQRRRRTKARRRIKRIFSLP